AMADEKAVCGWIDEGNGQVAERFWTLDPIDGTKGFLRGDQYVVALALIDRGVVQVAAIACPALPVNMDELDGDCGLLFVAVRGEGAKARPLSGGEMHDVRVADSGNAKAWRFAESVEASHGDHDAQSAIARAVGIKSPSLRMDSQAKYGAVSRGDAALYLRLPSPKYPDYREKIWDHAAGSLIVEEAGGCVTDMYGKPLDFATAALMEDNRGVIVSAGDIHDEVIAALNRN
ncbi:MAG: inositol monophosphatase family protein, partial [Candidatus Latescibacteria bacterium]|nr:inositol monophosphatase family protein [Candidatus Latescibacterota bacterium]